MLSPSKWVYAKYRFIIVKMHSENSKNDHALRNLNAMCDVELTLGFFIFFHCLNVCIHSPKFLKVKMFCV
jgi:hypothetical protein